MTSISIEERTSGDAVHTTTPYPGMPSDPVNTDYDSVVVHGMNPLLAYNSARNVDYFGADFAGDTALEFPSVDTQTQRKAHNNKLAQRRARARKKTHAQAVEAQLAVASAELQQLQSKQKALEARNSLLEKIVQLEHAQQPSDCVAPAANFNLQEIGKACGFAELPGPAANLLAKNKAVKLELCSGPGNVIALEDLAKLPLTKFAALYSGCVAKFEELLTKLSESEDTGARQQLHAAVVECKCLIVAVAIISPSDLIKIARCKMDEGTKYPKPCDDLKGIVAALQLTAHQKSDALHLRRLFHSKLRQLARRQSALLIKMTPTEEILDKHGSLMKLQEMHELSKQLQQNGREDYRTHAQFTAALYDGVLTSEQYAIGSVFAYPYIPGHKRWLEVLAADEREPASQALLEDDSVDDAQHAANWDAVVAYLSAISLEQSHLHVAFPG